MLRKQLQATILIAFMIINVLLIMWVNEKSEYLIYWGNNVGNIDTYYLKSDRDKYEKYMGDVSVAIMQSPEAIEYKYINSRNIKMVNSVFSSEGGFTGQKNEAVVEDKRKAIGEYVEYSNKKYEVVGYLESNNSLEWINSIILMGENPHDLNSYISIKLINPINIDQGLELDESIITESRLNVTCRYVILIISIAYLIFLLVFILKKSVNTKFIIASPRQLQVLLISPILVVLIMGITVIVNFPIKVKGNDKTNYQIASTYDDEQKFELFLNDIGKIDRMACFYNGMVDRNEFDYLSLGGQHISLEGIELKKENYLTYGTADSIFYDDDAAEYRNSGVKSIQLNKEALERFGIGLNYIQNIAWKKIDYNDRIPILLGDSYKDSKLIGDVLVGSNYISNKSWEVIGYIDSNKLLYHDSHSRLKLDNYNIYLYPLHADRSKFSSDREYGFTTDSMLYGKIAPNIPLSLEHIKIIAKREADKCNFHDYDIFSDFPSDDAEAHRQFINKSYQNMNIVYIITNIFGMLVAGLIVYVKRGWRYMHIP